MCCRCFIKKRRKLFAFLSFLLCYLDGALVNLIDLYDLFLYREVQIRLQRIVYKFWQLDFGLYIPNNFIEK